MTDQPSTPSAPPPGRLPRRLALDYAGPFAEDRSLGARVADTLLWVAAWLLALTVLGALCLIPAMCESPGLLRYLD